MKEQLENELKTLKEEDERLIKEAESIAYRRKFIAKRIKLVGDELDGLNFEEPKTDES